ncbi:MAG TPA: hypothetical protein VGJ00_00180 [Rhabdochlamydiaceae bacterium]|jgi:hypothetical protein
MVNGLERFRQHFAPYIDQYVLIGGTACTVIMQEAGLDFRATKDLDIVLYVESLHENFVKAFWQFVDEGGYKNKQHSTMKEIFYRFSSPSSRDYPVMLELFSRIPDRVKLYKNGHLTPIPIDEAIASLSAILLDVDYYHFIHSGKLIIDGLSILNATHLIPIKARAYIDLTNRKKIGEIIDDRDIRKHKNDIIRLFQLLSPNTRISLPAPIRKDFQLFLGEMNADSSFDCKSLGLKNRNANKIVEILKEIYL